MTANCRVGVVFFFLSLSSLKQAGQAGQREEGRAKALSFRALGAVGTAPHCAPVWAGQRGQGHVPGAARLTGSAPPTHPALSPYEL